jgi:hypothetical protein
MKPTHRHLPLAVHACAEHIRAGVRRHVHVLTLAALSLSVPAAHAEYTCTGKVVRMQSGPGADFTISLQGEGVSLDTVLLCNTRTEVHGIDPSTCKSIQALVTTAYVTDRTLTFWFDFSYSGPPKCTNADHPRWAWLRQSGWYWGPTIP